MQKTYLELATETVTAMINKGYLKVVPDKGETWEKQNAKSVKTVGWAILEMYREIMAVPQRAKEEKQPPKGTSKLITKI